MTIEVLIALGIGIWFGTTLMVIRNNVLVFKMLNQLPLTYEGTKQISAASWGGLCWYAAIWPIRLSFVLLANLWAFGPSILFRLVYVYFVKPMVGEKPVPKEVQDMLNTVEEIRKTAQRLQEEVNKHENDGSQE